MKPSPSPRNSEKVPSVTISGGNRSRVINSALRPPAAVPISSVPTAAAGMGQPKSRYNSPNSTADNPISEPTDKSMPPVTMTGVIATAKQSDFHQQPRDLERVRPRQEIRADRAEDDNLGRQHGGQHQLVRDLEATQRGGFTRGRELGWHAFSA